MKPLALILCSIFIVSFAFRPAFAQSSYGNPIYHKLADSIRQAYSLPCVGYAVIRQDGRLELEVIGVKRLGDNRAATIHDAFRIGSNTKAITAYLAAILVNEGAIRWETKFFELYPKWKPKARRAYHELTLQQLLNHRTRLPKWTYTNEEPKPADIQGNETQQREAFAQWALLQKPVKIVGNINASNLGYVLAGLMLEKASGRSYEDLVEETFRRLDAVSFGYGTPRAGDGYPIVGHDTELKPDPLAPDVRLNWLMAAGNLNISLMDYARVMDRFLDHACESNPEPSWFEAQYVFFGSPEFSLGWFWSTDTRGNRYAHNLGNPGTFICRTLVAPSNSCAYIVFANCMTDRGHEGTALLMERLSGIHQD